MNMSPSARGRPLQKQGVEFCCGKSELLRTGGFDGVDLALNHACTYDSLRK